MNLTDYHAKYFAHELTKRCSSDSAEKLAGALVDAQVDLNPHQIEAALFAFHSPLSKGALLADEVGLGKTIEAGLVVLRIRRNGHAIFFHEVRSTTKTTRILTMTSGGRGPPAISPPEITTRRESTQLRLRLAEPFQVHRKVCTGEFPGRNSRISTGISGSGGDIMAIINHG